MLLFNPPRGLADAAPDIEQLLNAADEQRSASPERYAALLNQLKLAAGEMSDAQRSYLNYLLAYQAAYSGNHQQSEMMFKALMAPSIPILLRFRATFTLANVQIVRRQFVEAFSNLSQAILLSADVDDMKWRNQGLLSGAAIYSEAGLYQESIDFIALIELSLEPSSIMISSILL